MTYVKTRLKKAVSIKEIITIHYFEYDKKFHFSGERHDFWEFLYVDHGAVRVTTDEDSLILKKGSIIFHKPNEFHAIESLEKEAPNLIAVSFTSDSPALNLLEHATFEISTEERFLLSHLIAHAREALSTPLHLPSIEQIECDPNAPFASEQLIGLYLELFLITIIRSRFRDSFENTEVPALPLPSLEVSQKRTRRSLLNAITAYMTEHLREPLTIETICKEFNISRSTLHKLFQEEKGMGIIQYFNRQKIEEIKTVLRSEEKSLTEIVSTYSYSSEAYFSKQFKRITGMSPTEYIQSVKSISNTLLRSGKKRDS